MSWNLNENDVLPEEWESYVESKLRDADDEYSDKKSEWARMNIERRSENARK